MLITLMVEVASIINMRPLVPVSTDPDDPVILNLAMLLTQKVSTPISIEKLQRENIFKHQWKYVQHLAYTFWDRWRKQ